MSIVDMRSAVDTAISWAKDRHPRTIFVRDVASLMLAVDQPNFCALHDASSLIVPDGQPLVWLGKMVGHDKIGRVAGADFVDAVCSSTSQTELTHFFYGGKPGVAEAVADNLRAKYPALKIAGTLSPPMREIEATTTFDEIQLAELATIRAAQPDFVWIGISSPKQDYWMMKAAPLIGRGVFTGVGAAFDFHAGTVKRAPAFMRNNGLEWLYRLLREPRRLWRRYLILAPRFVWLLIRTRNS
ncbi:WecB/TagA/CpsF family glycosyltransferase [Devosia sp. J2-20]|uniref:WecB/TagA/CpsF family glycosyltransferase n=1 Tax=Devosia sp. J2-20 TaxID=3026161 RepID=UPI00249BD449|nr:WecB/TagA/CpsF family glycosyltransferase [Devosia sp. J2-20]WDQ99679.1 WecB/TagA/CpsF family glycosyltransferase [Devosia sp. J2-20]